MKTSDLILAGAALLVLPSLVSGSTTPSLLSPAPATLKAAAPAVLTTTKPTISRTGLRHLLNPIEAQIYPLKELIAGRARSGYGVDTPTSYSYQVQINALMSRIQAIRDKYTVV